MLGKGKGKERFIEVEIKKRKCANESNEKCEIGKIDECESKRKKLKIED